MGKARPDPEGVLRHVAAMDPPGRRTISTAEAQAVLDELAALRAVAAELEADLLKVEGFRADLAARCFRQAVELDELRTRGAAPAETEGDGGKINRADCDQCGGTGCDPATREDDDEPSVCEDCDGRGRVVRR